MAIISINTPGEEANKFARRSEIKDVLSLFFDDIEYDEEKGIFMTEEDADKILAFVDKCEKQNIDELWVHCDAGISRSAGVAGAILKILTGDDSQVFDSFAYCPNMHCYRTVLNQFYKGE